MNFINYLQTKYTYSPRTLQDKQTQIENWKNLTLKNQPLQTLKPKELLQLIEIQKKKYKIQSLNNQLKTLEQYYNYLIETHQIQKHPLKDFRIKTDTKPMIQGLLTEKELTEIYTNYPQQKTIPRLEPYRQRNKVILGLIIYQALDNSTLEKLEIQHINLEQSIIQVPRISEHKLQQRILPIETNQKTELETYLTKTRKELLALVKTESDTNKLFPKSHKTKFSSITKTIKKQINNPNLLTLRYSRIALWIKQTNLIQAKYNSGYRSIKSLEKLDLTNLEKLKQDIEKYHPL